MDLAGPAPGFLPPVWPLAAVLLLLCGVTLHVAARGRLRAWLVGNPPFMGPLAAAVVLAGFFDQFLGPWAAPMGPYGALSWNWSWPTAGRALLLVSWELFALLLVGVAVVASHRPSTWGAAWPAISVAAPLILYSAFQLAYLLVSRSDPQSFWTGHQRLWAVQLVWRTLVFGCLLVPFFATPSHRRRFAAVVAVATADRVLDLVISPNSLGETVRRMLSAGWVGYACAVGLLASSLCVLLGSRDRPPPGCCMNCGYDLFGLPSPRCPECGNELAPSPGQHS